MAKPKYTIGDAFLIERRITNDGCVFTGKFAYYILSMTVEATDSGYSYKYGLGTTFPQAYVTGSVTQWNYESALDKFERAESYFGDNKELPKNPADWLGLKSLEGYNG